ncbi:MAG: right-handed parallel beta-helix repeat-containing protein [Bacteroidota bacterium]
MRKQHIFGLILWSCLLYSLISCTNEGMILLKVGDEEIGYFSSLEAAVEASRNHSNDQRSIQIPEGKYFIDAPIELGKEDQGLVIESVSESKPQIFGGVPITNWEKTDGAFWKADLNAYDINDWFFRSLMVNGRYAERSRYPEEGRLEHLTKWTKRWLSTVEGGWEEKPTSKDLTQFKFKAGDLGNWLDVKNAEITIFHSWDETLSGIKSVDIEGNTLTTNIEVGHPMGAFGVRDYIIWNTKKGLTKPGQWFLDKNKMELIYWPLPEEKMDELEVIAPVLEHIFKIENTSNITIKNLSLHSTTTPLIVGDFAAKLFDGAINLRESSNCVFDNINISGATGWGIKAFGESITIKNCGVSDSGAGGIRLIGSNATIENNHIHHIGQTYPSAIGLYAGVTDPKMLDEWEYGKNKENVKIIHNEIHDTPYIGIGLGGKDHQVVYNKVYRAMNEVADGSGIYATFCKNVIIRHNLVRDIEGGKHGQISSYYLDELSDNALIESNISINVSRPNHNHLCKNNIIRGNIFVNDGPMKVTNPRCDSITYENNVFVANGSLTLFHNSTDLIRNNLFDLKNNELLESIYVKKYKNGSPRPMNPANNILGKARLRISGDDVIFDAQSPAKRMDITPVKGSETGITRE